MIQEQPLIEFINEIISKNKIKMHSKIDGHYGMPHHKAKSRIEILRVVLDMVEELSKDSEFNRKVVEDAGKIVSPMQHHFGVAPFGRGSK